jgi:cell division protein FtsI (penicillin-binding protein 3)
MDAQEKWIRFRIRLVGLCFIAAFGLITVRAFQLQVLGQEEWQRRAERQHQKVIPLTPQRGTIFDRNGEELALSLEVDSIFVEPQKIADPAGAARPLAAALSLPLSAVEAKLNSNRGFLWLKRQVLPRESARVRELDLPGVNFVKEHRRYYPNSEVGAQVLGFTGLDPEGLEGLELRYDSVMLGQGGYLVTERDALGRGMGGGGPAIKGGSRGSDLHLTLDKNLQYIAEKELAAGVRKAKARAGTVVVMEPRTGEVLAMASQPDYNPNAFHKYRPSQWRNRALCDTFEPGSTMKIFLLAAALNEKIVRPGEAIDCEQGVYKVGGKVIHDHHPYGNLTLSEVLKYSSNIGAAKIGKSLERERLYRYLTDFGFGSPTGLDLPGEVGGVLRKPSRWFEVDLAAISFGQGMTVTPVQLASATAVIANGGFLMAPYVVERVVDSFGETVERRQPREVRQVVSSEVARRIREMMAMTTEGGGTGTLAAVPGFRVAGKTGTAQKVDPVTGGYSVDKRVSSFVGFVPAEEPRLVILVIMDEPEEKTYGGLVAAPVFSRIADQALRYLKIAPTEPGLRNPLPVHVDKKGALPPKAVAGFRFQEPGNEQGAPRMPDCVGMSSRQVLQTMGRTGVNIKLKGHGRVVEQSPSAGRPIEFGSEVWVRLAPPA